MITVVRLAIIPNLRNIANLEEAGKRGKTVHGGVVIIRCE